MQIGRTVFSNARLPSAATPAPAVPAPLDPVDGMRVLGGMERIPKQGHKHELLGHAKAADGALYLLYGESSTGSGYVARVTPQGRIDWEAPVQAPRCLAADAGGGVTVAGQDQTVRFTSGGLALESKPLRLDADPLWVDPRSGGVVGLRRDHRLAASSSLDVPRAASGATVETVVISPDGDSVRVATPHGWGELRPDAPSRSFPLPSDAPTPGVWLFTDDVHPIADGGAIYEMHRTVEVPMRPFFGGILMPNHRGPAELGHDYDTRISLRRLAPDGSTAWETPMLGRMLEVDVELDGSAWAASESHGSVGSNTVYHVLPDGTVGGRAEVEGPVHGVLANGDEAFVSNREGIVRADAGGNVALIPATKGWRGRSLTADGRLLVEDESKLRAALLDPRSGALTPLTDSDNDHVLTRRDQIERAVRDLPSPAEMPPAPQVIVQDEWVLVGEVRVPRRHVEG